MTNAEGFLKENIDGAYYNRPSLWGRNYWSDLQLERAKATVMLLPEGIRSVLDVGCGAGIVSKELKRRVFSVVSVDFAFNPLKQLRYAQIPCAQGDACSLPFRDGAFDAVIATELIEHLSQSERRQVLKEMGRISQRFILLTVPYREVLASGLVKCIDCGCTFNAFRHTKSFDESDMNSMLHADFILERIKLFGPLIKRIPKAFVMLAHLFGGYRRPEPGSVECPQCKNVKNYLSKRNWIILFLLGVPSRVLPLRKYPNWMGALYEKRSV
jgi:SAM-dependent methyltransferase